MFKYLEKHEIKCYENEQYILLNKNNLGSGLPENKRFNHCIVHKPGE